MKKIFGLLMVVLGLVGCGEQVTVGPSEVAYIVSSSGISEQELKPGAQRLPFCWPGQVCPSAIYLSNALTAHEIDVARVFLPKSKVDLVDVTAAVQFRIRDKMHRKVISDVTPTKGVISNEAIWSVYLQRVVPAMIIDSLKGYTIDETLVEVDKIGHDVKKRVNEALKDMPVEVTELSFNNGIGKVPDQVITSLRALYAVNADQERQIKALQAGIEVENQHQSLQKVRLANDLANAKEAGIPYDVYVQLKVFERFSDAAESSAAKGVPWAIGSNVLAPLGDKK